MSVKELECIWAASWGTGAAGQIMHLHLKLHTANRRVNNYKYKYNPRSFGKSTLPHLMAKMHPPTSCATSCAMPTTSTPQCHMCPIYYTVYRPDDLPDANQECQSTEAGITFAKDSQKTSISSVLNCLFSPHVSSSKIPQSTETVNERNFLQWWRENS